MLAPRVRAAQAALRAARGARGLQSWTVGTDKDAFVLPDAAREAFKRDGYVVLRGLVTEEELRPIEQIYDRFMRQDIKIPGKDFCDMSQSFDVKPENFSIVNAMLPERYYPPLAGNVYLRRAEAIANQLFGTPMAHDYSQFLDKRPRKPTAVFAWHQDMAYWPPPHMVGGDTRTATFSLALDATRKANGCLKFIPGSQRAQTVRPHVPIGGSRDDAHAIAIKVDEAAEPIVYVEIDRCDVSIHDEYVVHGSAGNLTDGHRRTYVAAWRTAGCVAKERELGFDHSHNTNFNWDKFNKW